MASKVLFQVTSKGGEARIQIWKEPKLNYRLIAKNGETLYATTQGFERVAGVKKNVAAIVAAYDPFHEPGYRIKVEWVKNSRSKTVLKTETWSA